MTESQRDILSAGFSLTLILAVCYRTLISRRPIVMWGISLGLAGIATALYLAQEHGIQALVLEANPNLSYRDVKYILATTATRNHPNQPAVTLADGRTLVPGWTVNAANRAYSNWYGFGVVNAARAVQVAENFQSLGALVDSGWRTTTRHPRSGTTAARTTWLTVK